MIGWNGLLFHRNLKFYIICHKFYSDYNICLRYFTQLIFFKSWTNQCRILAFQFYKLIGGKIGKETINTKHILYIWVQTPGAGPPLNGRNPVCWLRHVRGPLCACKSCHWHLTPYAGRACANHFPFKTRPIRVRSPCGGQITPRGMGLNVV